MNKSKPRQNEGLAGCHLTDFLTCVEITTITDKQS